MKFELSVNADTIDDVRMALERALWDVAGVGKRPPRPARRRGSSASIQVANGKMRIDAIRSENAYGGPVDDRDPERARMSWRIKYPGERRWVERNGELQ